MKWFNSNFFKKAGFYFSLVSVISLIAAVLSYTNGFTGTLLEYNGGNVMTIAIAGIAAFALLLLFKPTANYAPLVLWGGSFASLLAYISNIYMYFTGVFYNGVSAEAFALIDPVVLISTILFLISFVTANIAMYMKHSAEEDKRDETA